MDKYPQIRDFLYSLKNLGSRFGIDRMLRLVEALGHPQKKFSIVHVAGTNGKGSVCAMLEALYRENGYRTGLFTSPHLVHLGERVQVEREMLSEAGIVRYVEQLRPMAAELGREEKDLHPTFFEFVTAMGFLHFADAAVDLALIETGLGGRLDATNVVEPELSIITSISFDHMEFLGDTLAKIAGEKVGIIKPGKPVLIGCLPEEAETVVRATAEARGCRLYAVRGRFAEDSLPETNLSGDFQRWNAAVAIYATEILTERFPIRSTDALMQVEWAGRWQKLEHKGRTLILDATHNPEGAEALKGNLEKLVEASGKPIMVAGTLGEKRGRSLMGVIAPYVRELYLVEPNQDRATSAKFLASCLPEGSDFPVHFCRLHDLFVDEDLRANARGTPMVGKPGDTIIVTGSIYLIGEVLERLEGRTGNGGDLQDKL